MHNSTKNNSGGNEPAVNTPAKSKLSKYSQQSDVERGRFLLELYQKASLLSEKELNDYFLDHAVTLTGSTIGFFHFVSEDQKSIILTAWNGEALKSCTANYETHYPIDSAGNWVDCVRSGQPTIYNDFARSPNQKGVPEGHVTIKRFMSIPIIENGKVKIVFGVGNKTEPYVEDDVVQLQLIASELAKIYKQRQTEITLRESEKKYRGLFENMIDGFALCRMIFDEQSKPVDFVYLEINHSFERLTGLKRDAVVGKKVTEAIPGIEKGNPELFEIYGKVALTGIEEKFEVFFKPLNKWFSISVYSPQKGYFVAVFEDVTDRKVMEAKLEGYSKHLENLVEERTKQLKDAERLAAIGATAGMVGHDIRNPLQAITSDVYLAKTDLALTPESEEKRNVQESLEEIEKNVSYINKIVADLQDFARPIKPKLDETDLEEIIHSVLIRLNIPGNVKVKHSVRKDFPKLKTDQSYLQRILTNLANNAIQAMPNGGKLAINAFSKNGKAIITVEDNGEGIPESVRTKLFAPLVTTKSKGQGFGLSVVKRFTEGLGGTVNFESDVGKGTKFVIELPFDSSAL